MVSALSASAVTAVNVAEKLCSVYADAALVIDMCCCWVPGAANADVAVLFRSYNKIHVRMCCDAGIQSTC